MHALAAVCGVVLFLATVFDFTESIIVPRPPLPPRSHFQFSFWFYKGTWPLFRSIGRTIRSGSRREHLLAAYGPMFLPALFLAWAFFLVLCFALLQWAAGLQVASEKLSFMDSWFFSSGTFLSFASDKPATSVAKLLTGVEAAAGFGFIALLVSYLPVMYQADRKSVV